MQLATDKPYSSTGIHEARRSRPTAETSVSRLTPLLKSADQTWNTPRSFLDRVERALGPIGLDPCSNATSVVHARREFRLDRGEDGLLLPWRDHGLVFVNPPFGRHLLDWSLKMARDGDELVALVPSRTDTAWWHCLADASIAFVLWRGRITFRRRRRKLANAPFPSCVFYRGPRLDAFVAEFSRSGRLVTC